MQDIPQLVNPGEVAARTLLPSFLYVPGELDFPAGSLALPWDAHPRLVVGELARRARRREPGAAGRLGEVVAVARRREPDRADPALGRARRGRRTSRRSMRRPSTCGTWPRRSIADVAGRATPTLALAHQDVLLTVPASFDEEARELTLEAAAAAGLEHVTLLEEPQAAFYAWLDALGDGWRRRVERRRSRPGLRRRRRHDRLQPDRRRRAGRRPRRSSAWRSASTSCSAATTWISRWRACSSSGSRPPAIARHLAAARALASVPGSAKESAARATRAAGNGPSRCSAAARG